ncbi:hypothetical protein NY78_4254 [Desulfovibrio sp. TomC]|nr:hypothetical protein NY78_4254 [Desulfovibrio sp. TomC]
MRSRDVEGQKPSQGQQQCCPIDSRAGRVRRGWRLFQRATGILHSVTIGHWHLTTPLHTIICSYLTLQENLQRLTVRFGERTEIFRQPLGNA